MTKVRSPAKNVWTRDEYALLLRAWQDVVDNDAEGTPSSKSAVVERMYERFVELSNGACKRTENALGTQKAVLTFNFNFIVRYNLAHGANAWVSLDPTERAAVFAREKTSSYNYIDLDPSMMQAMANIRSHLEAAAGDKSEKSSPKRPKLLKTTPAPRVKVVPRMSASDAATRAITSECRSRKIARRSSASSSSSDARDSSNESESSGYETPEPVAERTAIRTAKRTRRTDGMVRIAKTELAAIVAAHKKTARDLERLLASDGRRHRLAGAAAEPPLTSVDL